MNYNMSKPTKPFPTFTIGAILMVAGVGCIVGMLLSIDRVATSDIFNEMAEGMTCESLNELYVEDPEPVYQFPINGSSWWYAFVPANDAMGNEIVERCT